MTQGLLAQTPSFLETSQLLFDPLSNQLFFQPNFYLAEKTEELDIQELKVKLNKENLEEYEILTKEDSMKVTYQLTQSRKLKSGELHYIDHPKFGIIYRLVKAEKIEQS